MRSQIIAKAVSLAVLAGLAADTVFARPHHQPTVKAPAGSILGYSTDGIETFAGIPFAEPPVGHLRLRPPVRLNHKLERFNASGPAPYCPQIPASPEGLAIIEDAVGPGVFNLPNVTGQEDCLTITVKRPAGVDSKKKLPVLFWIYGGGFQTGGTEQFDGTSFTANANRRHQPFVFVAVSYRLGGFGFLGGKEVLADGAANLGLLDQRLGLEWVADNIASFGGDPKKVTIWGESAGAISVTDQLALYDGDNTYKGKPLFRGAIMNSGSLLPADTVDTQQAQVIYDHLVDTAGCTGPDSLDCLRSLDFEAFYAACNSVGSFLSYRSVSLAYLPRPDGRTLTDSPDVLFRTGRFTPVPMINGFQEDEGTLFGLFPQNVTTTSALIDYLSTITFTRASQSQLEKLVHTYPTNPAAGSPYGTGDDNQLFPGYKRLASLAGDILFILQRRMALSYSQAKHPGVPTWSYMGSYGYGTPVLGSSHASDILYFFADSSSTHIGPVMQEYYTNFIHHLDPNIGGSKGGPKLAWWPQWGVKHELIRFMENSTALVKDNFRSKAYAVLSENFEAFRW